MRHWIFRKMKANRWIAAVALVLAAGSAARAQQVAFAWEGERTPLERERYFYAGDYPSMRPLIAKVRDVGKPNGLAPCAFSMYLKVPDDGQTRCVARFLTGAGTGLQDYLAMMLAVRPAAGGGREIVLAKFKNGSWEEDYGHTVRAPFPAGDKWVHVAFSITQPAGTGSLVQQAMGEARLAVDGRMVTGMLWNDLWGVPFCAGIALGAPGVSVGKALAITNPNVAMRNNPTYLARLNAKQAPARAAATEPWLRFTFDGHLRPEGLVAGIQPQFRGPTAFTPTPNGQAVTVASHCVWDLAKMPSESFTLTAVGKADARANAALVSWWIDFNNTKECGRVVLRTATRSPDVFQLVYSPYGRPTATNPAGELNLPVSDASAAFHHYAIVCEGDTLRAFVDGRPAPGAVTLPKVAADAFHARNFLSTFQACQQLGGGCVSQNAALDDVAFWPRALTAAEIAADAKRFRLTGVARAASGAPAAGGTAGPAAAPAGSSLALPSLPAGQPFPAAAARAEANAVLDELLEGETPKAADLIALLRDAEEDATRHELLRRAGQALLKERRFGDAYAVTDLRARAFAGAVPDAEAAALLKEALRASAVKEPDTALAYARATLAFAEAHGRPGLVEQAAALTKQIERYLAKGKDHAAWRKTLAAARSSAQARAALADLRAKAKSGEPADLMALAEGLAAAGEWGEETLAAFVGSGDATLAAVAGDEAVAGDASAPQEALALADRWWAAAEATEKDKKPALARALRAHAAALYARGKPAAVGLRVRLIERRIEEGGAQ